MPFGDQFFGFLGGVGKSAYQTWLDQPGNQGSEQDFLDSLKVPGASFTVGTPSSRSVTVGTGFQPRPDGASFVVVTCQLAGALQVSTVTASLSATQAGAVYAAMPIVVSTTTGVSANNIGGFVVAPGHWVKVTQSGISLLSNLTLNAIVWSL